MNDTKRLREIENYLKLTTNALSKAVGLKNAQTLYDIHNGKHGISKDLAMKITAKYLDVDFSWLMTGEGEMLKNNEQKIGNSKNSTIVGSNVSGSGNNIGNTAGNIDKLLDEMAEQRKMFSNQIDRLLTLLENK